LRRVENRADWRADLREKGSRVTRQQQQQHSWKACPATFSSRRPSAATEYFHESRQLNDFSIIEKLQTWPRRVAGASLATVDRAPHIPHNATAKRKDIVDTDMKCRQDNNAITRNSDIRNSLSNVTTDV
jgi:hypothetical protein